MTPEREELARVLRDACDLLALPDNDFTWSGWEDAADALAEVQPLIAILEAGSLPHRGSLSILFLPTGPIQETSLSSGWSDAFIALANRFDAAERKVYDS